MAKLQAAGFWSGLSPLRTSTTVAYKMALHETGSSSGSRCVKAAGPSDKGRYPTHRYLRRLLLGPALADRDRSVADRPVEEVGQDHPVAILADFTLTRPFERLQPILRPAQ